MLPDNPSNHTPPPSTGQLVQWDRQYLWHPFTPMTPWCQHKEIVVIERGEGEFLIDTQGRRYIDGVSSLWCNVHGHCVPELDEAVRRQLKLIAHSTMLGLANVPAILLGRRLVELARACGLMLDRVFYSDNGSTAVEVACKMAFQYWRNAGMAGGVSPAGGPRTKFLAFQNAYHGDTLGAVSVGGIPLFHQAFAPLTFAVDFVRWDPESRDPQELLGEVETLLGSQQYAGVVIEPLIQGAGGMRMFARGVLKGLRDLCDSHDTLLIADEVMTGFGRTGTMFACQQEGVTPDLLCLSKGLTAGYMPLGATLTTQRVFEAFCGDPRAGKTFYHGHTYTGHPLACATALASLDLFERGRLLEHVAKLMPILGEALERAGTYRYVSQVRQCGLIGAIDLADTQKGGAGAAFPAHWRIGGELCRRMRSLGLMMRPLADTVVLMPPLAIKEDNLVRLCSGVVKALEWLPEIVERERAQEAGRG